MDGDSAANSQQQMEETRLHCPHSRLYYSGMTMMPWRLQLISGALPLNKHLRTLVPTLGSVRKSELQALVWPHIVFGVNVTFIDNPVYSVEPSSSRERAMDSTFVTPVLLRIAEPCGKRHLRQYFAQGPLAVIVCLTAEEANSIVDAIKMASQQFDRNFRTVTLFESAIDNKMFVEKAYEIAERCDILIVSLFCVMDLFSTHGRLHHVPINVNNVEVVTFRDLNVMLRADSELVKTVINRFQTGPNVNYVYACSSASQEVKKLVSAFKGTNFFASSNYIDAILYDKLPIELLDLYDEKMSRYVKAQKAFEGRKPGEKAVVYVADDKEASAFGSALRFVGNKQSGAVNIPPYDLRIVKENQTVFQAKAEIKQWWNRMASDQMRILLIPDKFNGDLEIYDADLLVHFAEPESMPKFLSRFVCIKDKSFTTWTSYYNSLARGQGDGIDVPRIPCCVAVDQRWYNILPLLVRLALSSSEYSIVPQRLISDVESILSSPRFINVPICQQQLYFGDCIYKGSCFRRHHFGERNPILSDLLKPEATGLQFSIMRMMNPCHFVVRLLKVHRENGKVVPYDEMQKDLYAKLNAFLKNLPEPMDTVPRSNVVCGMVDVESNRIHRVNVLREIDENRVHIYYIDEGVGMPIFPEDFKHPKLSAQVKISRVKFHALPEDLQCFPKTWTHLIIPKVLPSNHERHWRQSTCTEVFQAMKPLILNKAVFESGGALFACEDFIFVDNMKCYEKQDGRRIVAWDMRNRLKRHSHFAPNNEHLANLMNAVNEKLPKKAEPTFVPIKAKSSPSKPVDGEPMRHFNRGDYDLSVRTK